MSMFNKTDYKSSNGMQSYVFGPPLWHTLHIISFNYPVNPTADDKKSYTNFLMSLEHVLPCKYCRVNFKKNLKNSGFSPAVMESRDTFSKYIYKLHNCINDMLGKNIVISYNEVRSRYEHFRSRCSESEEKEQIIKQQLENKKESGCNDSLYGKKSKTVIRIVPKESKVKNFKMDPRCKSTKSKSHK